MSVINTSSIFTTTNSGEDLYTVSANKEFVGNIYISTDDTISTNNITVVIYLKSGTIPIYCGVLSNTNRSVVLKNIALTAGQILGIKHTHSTTGLNLGVMITGYET